MPQSKPEISTRCFANSYNYDLKNCAFSQKKKNCSFLSRAVWVPREGALPSPLCGCPQGHPEPPLCPGSYVLFHFLAQLLALPGVRFHQVLREKPGQPQRQPVGNWKEKFPNQTPSFLVREITHPEAGSTGTHAMFRVQLLGHQHPNPTAPAGKTF